MSWSLQRFCIHQHHSAYSFGPRAPGEPVLPEQGGLGAEVSAVIYGLHRSLSAGTRTRRCLWVPCQQHGTFVLEEPVSYTASFQCHMTAIVLKSMGLQDWALGHMENLMKSVLPLAFHPLTMMRRAVAVFLAPLLFIPMMQLIKADIFVHVGAIQRTATLPVTPLLQQHYYVPFPVKETSLDSAAATGSTAAEAEKDHGMVAELIGEQGSQKMHLVQLLISLGKLKDRITCNERPHDNSRDVFAVQNFQERECVIKRCLELLEASGMCSSSS